MIKRFLKKISFGIIFKIISKPKLKQQLLNKEEKVLIKLQDEIFLKNNSFYKSYLQEKGWIQSVLKQEIIEEDGAPIPWMTYPFISFLKPRIKNTFEIFEYGSGNSTIFFAQRAKNVYAIEHDIDWYNRMKSIVAKNVTLIFEELHYGGKYCNKVMEFDGLYDLIVVDGRDRVNCCLRAPKALKNDGVIILDNSNRKYYNKGIEFLLESGFKKLDFEGMSPKSPQLSCTSVFYKTDNCLGI